MSENITTASAFPGYLLVVHLYGYPIPMKLNKGGVGGLLLIFSPPQSIPSLVGITKKAHFLLRFSTLKLLSQLLVCPALGTKHRHRRELKPYSDRRKDASRLFLFGSCFPIFVCSQPRPKIAAL